jgi:hypothetical protein
VTDDHERIDELLAGYALRSLSGEEAAEADRLLGEHVPTCERCRATLRDFVDVGGELALAASPVAPPDLVLPRLRQSIDEPRVPSKRRRPLVAWSAAVAAAAAMVGFATWNTVALNHRVSRTETTQANFARVVSVISDPRSKTVPLGEREITTPPARANILGAYVPGQEEMSITGTAIPDPAPGHVYRLWLVQPGGASTFAGAFLPEEGFVALFFSVDLAAYSGMLITDEDESTPIQRGPTGHVRWATEL